jgi:hypothetical protein
MVRINGHPAFDLDIAPLQLVDNEATPNASAANGVFYAVAKQ